MSRKQKKRQRRNGAVGGRSNARAEALFRSAATAHQAGRLGEAADGYRAVLDVDAAHSGALQYLGLLLHQSGKPDEAIELLVRAAAANPSDAVCQNNLGNMLRERQRMDEALTAYRAAVSAAPDYVNAQYNLATLLQEAGDTSAAVTAFQAVTRLAPEDAEVWNSLGTALAEAGALDGAGEALERAVALRPDYAEAFYNLGGVYRDVGRTADAEKAFRRAIDHNPRYPEAHHNLGSLLRQEGRLPEAAAAYRDALVVRPRYVMALTNLGDVLREMGEVEEAVEVLREAVRQDPDSGEALGSLGAVLQLAGDTAGAREVFEAALARAPDSAEVHNNLGLLLMDEGDIGEAEAAFRRAIALRPAFPTAWMNLANSRRYGPDDGEDMAAMESALTAPDVDEEGRAFLGFALGKVRNDRKEYARAFEHYREANRLYRSLLEPPYDPARQAAFFDAVRQTFDKALFERRAGVGAVSERPVFIVGMPRSGTTLVEQILSSHPAVFGADELDNVREAAFGLPARLGTTSPYPLCVPDAAPDVFGALGTTYLDFLRGLAPEAARVTDKMPGNFVHLGLIALMLPGARVIHCQRDPLDTCLSCYFQRFTAGHEYAYDLKDLAAQYRGYERMMAHWHAVLPIPVFDVSYEALVEDTETLSRAMVDFCGLPWDDACLAHHRTERRVRTASHWQVRQPVYKTSRRRWKNYEQFLDELKRDLDYQEE